MVDYRDCSAVVVAVPQHIQFLPDLITELSSGVGAFGEIILVLSGFDDAPKADAQFSLPSLSEHLRVIHQPLQSAGANRNVGLSHARRDLVFFHDADDLYSRHRMRTALAVFQKHRFDLMLHGFVSFQHGSSTPSFPEPPDDIGKIKVVGERALYSATILESSRERARELKGETESTNILFNDPFETFEVHHAHAILRRDAVGDIRYHEEFGIRNEDGVFARDMLEAGKKVLLTPFVLSAYRHGARAKPRKPSNFFGRQR